MRRPRAAGSWGASEAGPEPDADGFSAKPVLTVEGSVSNPTAGVAVLGSPAQWLAVTAIGDPYTGPMFIALLDPTSTGTFNVGAVPDRIESDTEQFATGQALHDAGDRDGDGLHDLVVGAPLGDSASATDRTYVVRPGVDVWLEDALETWWGQEGTGTGFEVGAGDIDGDGRPELTIPSVLINSTTGQMNVAPWLGPGDHDLFDEASIQVLGEFPGDGLLQCVVEDADVDGFADIVVGAQQYLQGTPGKAMLFLGPLAGTVTHEDADRIWVGTDPGSRFGYELTAGDFDGNGVLDLAVGAPDQDSPDGVDVGAVHFIFDFGM